MRCSFTVGIHLHLWSVLKRAENCRDSQHKASSDFNNVSPQPFPHVDSCRQFPHLQRLSRARSHKGRTLGGLLSLLLTQLMIISFSFLSYATQPGQKPTATCAGLFLDSWTNLIILISLSGDKSRPPHLHARTNGQLKEEGHGGPPHKSRRFQGRKYPIITPATIR